MEKNNFVKKGYIIKKDDKCDDLMNVKDYYEDIKNYFKKYSNLKVGSFTRNKISFSEKNKIYSNEESIPEKHSNLIKRKKSKIETNTTQKLAQSYKKIKKNNSNTIYQKNISKKNKSNIPIIYSYGENNGIHYERKTLNEIKDIFKKAKLKMQKNLMEQKNNELIDFDEKLKMTLLQQKKILIKYENDNEKKNTLLNLISNKIKKNEKDLLINKVDDYRIKKQIFDYMNNCKSNRYIFGYNYWAANLRRSNNQSSCRVNYFSRGNKFKMPERVVDFGNKEIEIIYNSKNKPKNKYNSFINFLERNNSKDKFKKIKKIIQINEISILKGENLFNKEYKLLSLDKKISDKEKKNFKLYKDPEDKNNVDILFCKNKSVSKKIK